jgi:glycosyltransferase involved in cell wall biosynthesis
VALVLHFTAQSDPHGPAEMRPFYADAFRRIEQSEARERMIVLADSQELVDEYRDLNDRLDYHVAPIPHVPPWNSATRERSGNLNIGYLGEARENKGFHLLPYVVRRVSHRASAVHFHIHSFCHAPQSAFYRQSIAGLRGPHVTLYPDSLDDEEYVQFLDSLDVVLLPYTLQHYHSQTSGVFAEAMALGKSVIVPRGSWMARQLDNYGGGAAFNPDDAEDLARQVLAFIDGGVESEAAAERAKRWTQFHNPTNFLSLIFASTGVEADFPN